MRRKGDRDTRAPGWGLGSPEEGLERETRDPEQRIRWDPATTVTIPPVHVCSHTALLEGMRGGL